MLQDACKHFVWDFAVSETYLPLIPKTASEPTRHLFTSSDTFQNTKTQNYFPDLFQQNWGENQGFSVPHSKISTVTPALLSKQTSASSCMKRTCHVSTTNHVLLVLGPDHSCAMENRKGHPQDDTTCFTALQDLLCEAWFSGPARGMLKKHQTCRLLAARIHPLHSFQQTTSSLHLQFITAFALIYSNPTLRLHN